MNKREKNAILIFSILFFYFSVVWILYYIEKGVSDSNIKSFWDSLWYSVITLTTIGYGDRFPVSPFGRVVSLVFVIGSVGVLGFVISQISNRIYKFMEEKKIGYFGTKFQNHVVIVNWNNFAKQILHEITNAHKKAVVITHHKADVDVIYDQFDKDFVFVVHSEGLDKKTIDRANISNSTTVLLNYEDDTENLVQLITIKTPFPDLAYVISLNNSSLKTTFNQLGVTFTLAKNEVASKLIASYIFEPEVARITEGLMSSSVSDDELGIMQFKVTELNPYTNKKGQDTFFELKSKYNVILVGISKSVNNYKVLVKNPTNDHIIELHDYIIIMGNLLSKKIMTDLFGIEEGI